MSSTEGNGGTIRGSQARKKGLRISFFAGLSFFMVLVSLSFRLLYWRVANEPGAVDMPGLLLVHRLLLIAGTAGFSFFTISFIRVGKGEWWYIPVSLGLSVLAYLPLFGLTLLLMV